MSQPPLRRATLVALVVCAALNLVGCKDWVKTPTSAPTSGPSHGRNKSHKQVKSSPAQTNAQIKDDPRAPACFPQDSMAGNWAKQESIRVFDAGQVAQALPPMLARRGANFAIARISRCAYTFKHSKGAQIVANVLVIETNSSDDAYGLLSCQSSSTEVFKIAGETRVDRTAGLSLHCWQGRDYINVATTESDPETTEELIRLTMQITGRIGREDRPTLLDAMPQDPALTVHRWLIRNLNALTDTAFKTPSGLDLSRINSILGLTKDTLMCISAYDVPDAVRPNTVWIVRYPTAKLARDAHARYSKSLAASADPASQSTSLLPPYGPYLIGTWTAEEESLQFMLPRIQKLLPS